MGTFTVVSAQKADEIISGVDSIKLSRTESHNLKEGATLRLAANGCYHPIADNVYLITEIESVDDHYINAYFIEK